MSTILPILNKVKKHKFPYEWTLKDANFTKDKGTVFSTFASGGGSTLGYKLAGFDVIGMNEIDPKMANRYIANHNPKYSFIEDIRTFRLRDDLPKELFDLDILDGSPPCSKFSHSGDRAKGITTFDDLKQYREGQKLQRLDDLFFEFLALAERLQPKVIISENVVGIITGKAKKYAQKVLELHNEIGYEVKEYVLDSRYMGVPQSRPRVFFIAIRKDLARLLPKSNTSLFNTFPLIDMVFNEPVIPFKAIEEKDAPIDEKIVPSIKRLYPHVPHGKKFEVASLKLDGKKAFFGSTKTHPDRPLRTITATPKYVACQYHYEVMRPLTKLERLLGSSFPLDYDFGEDEKKFTNKYFTGMSVLPVVMAQISSRVYEYWLEPLSRILDE